MNIPRSEYPNPQFQRKNWSCLNGIWEFEIDKSNSGVARKLYEAESFEKSIVVPFCPESELSGINEKDFLNSVWYKRTVCINPNDGLVKLHIGACDYKTTVYVNGKISGTHLGGYTPIEIDVTRFVKAGDNTIVIHAEDDNRTHAQPRGKQSEVYHSVNCDYTRTTGIWQSVWIEYVPKTHVKSFKFHPDVNSSSVTVDMQLEGKGKLDVSISYEGRIVGSYSIDRCNKSTAFTIPLSETHLWEVGNGRLYDVSIKFGDDEVTSYFGLRNVELDGYKFLINGKSVFQRLVLDQGFYPTGIYTAPTDSDLEKDIQLALDVGFNGARLHQKLFEPRFLYHCDKLGYIVWGEYASWGIDHTKIDALPVFLREWLEALERDYNHPSIIGWCPFNETWNFNGARQKDEVIELIYKATKAVDTSRPCIDTSGNFHVITDIYDIHDYDQNPERFSARLKKFDESGELCERLLEDPIHRGRQKYNGAPMFVSEYGGIKWDVENDEKAWGYGVAPKTEEEYIERYRALTTALLECEKCFGFCYTQLYDIEQERNGIYTYSRDAKFEASIIKAINTQKAKIEE